MGLHPRHVRLVLDLLGRQRRRGLDARFFEIGYGAGTLLEQVRKAGFPFAGIEVSAAMQRDGRRASWGRRPGRNSTWATSSTKADGRAAAAGA